MKGVKSMRYMKVEINLMKSNAADICIDPGKGNSKSDGSQENEESKTGAGKSLRGNR